MPPIDPVATGRVLDEIASTSDGSRRGPALEKLIAEIFCAIPGVLLHDRDRLSASGNEELDLAFSNAQEPGGLTFFDRDLLVECKSQGGPVDAQAVNWFASKLRRRQQSLGVLVALNGVTGSAQSGSRAAAAEVEQSAIEGQQVIVVIGDELGALQSGEHLANLLTFKRQKLISGRLMAIAEPDQLRALSPVPAIPDSARLLLHPATNLAQGEADAWRLALDAGRLVLRRQRGEALAEIEASRPVIGQELDPGAASVELVVRALRIKLEALESSIEHDIEEAELRSMVVELAAGCVDLLRLDPSAISAPEPDIVAVNVETFAPNRLAIHVGSELWTLLTRYYLDQIDRVREQLRAAAMYSLLSLLVDQVLKLSGQSG
jgi:Restriction endonuclease